ncbi:MAG: sigma-70 family RNA polymerase sigma factor [Lewinellaceae bacterium]|nr:sigma-70 family RNA polymerase sigma factor [Lewinellaceae bacterium]
MANETTAMRHKRVFERELYPLMHAVYNFAVRLTNDATRAEDIVQETYMKAWRAIGNYQEGTNAKAWLFRICQNAFINDYRSKSRKGSQVDYEEIRVFHSSDDDRSTRYDHLHSSASELGMGDEIMTALNALNPDYRVVVLLDLEDFTYKEIAAILNVKLNTVRTRLHRARLELAKNLQGYAKQQGFGVSDATPAQDVPFQQDVDVDNTIAMKA